NSSITSCNRASSTGQLNPISSIGLASRMIDTFCTLATKEARRRCRARRHQARSATPTTLVKGSAIASLIRRIERNQSCDQHSHIKHAEHCLHHRQHSCHL